VLDVTDIYFTSTVKTKQRKRFAQAFRISLLE
jgi:hypothetical protein